MFVRLLGPVEVVGPCGRAALSGRQRTLVAVLALQAGTVVVAHQVVEALWGEAPPRTAVKSLHSHVARVRQALGACGLTDAIQTRGAGYSLIFDRSEVDACRFEDQVRRAREHLAQHQWGSAAECLRTGLALWSGDPLQDANLAGWARAEVTRLQEVKLAALEDLWDTELRLGRHLAAADELDRLLVRNPLRERLVELLMLALYRCGRPIDAMDAYQRLRERLSNELGVDPAPDLQRLYTAILQRDPDLGSPSRATPAPAEIGRPAQLPPRVGHFTGRASELRELDWILDDTGDTRIAVVSGAGGMGKTAVAVQWAHKVRHRFPDGQLFLDLRGRDLDGAMTPADALAHLLRGLGVPADQVPTELASATNLFRTLLDDRRMLIVLDNGSAADQVLPLVPPTPTSALIVTCRRPLTALSTYHAVRTLNLDGLADTEALALLRSVVGSERIDREPGSATGIAAACGGMPLALRIAAANLATEPHRTLGDLAAELAGQNRLDVLSVEGDSRSVRTTFASAYQALSAPAARMFCLLGLHPGTTFVRQLAAAVAGLEAAVADQALAELADAYLVAPVSPARYRFHDLIRAYASECARHQTSALAQEEAIDRLVDWYLYAAELAGRALDRGRDRVVPELRHRPAEQPFAPTSQETLDFLDEERDNLHPVVRFAAEHGRHTAAWQLTYLLTGFYDSRGRWADRVEICRLGLASAQRLADPAAEGLMRSGLGVAHIMTRRFEEALDCLYPALELTRATGDLRREGHVSNNIATAYAGLRRFDEALKAFTRALEVHRANGDRLGVALALNNIGTAHIRLGQPDLSFAQLTQALRLTREIDNPRVEAGVLVSLGEAYHRQQRFAEALDHLHRALDIRRSIGDRRREVDTLTAIGSAQLDQGDQMAALASFQAALGLSQDLADQHLISVCLAQLAGAHLRRHELDDARDCLQRALALRVRMPDAYEEATIHRALGELAQRTGQQAATTEHRERAIALFQKANATAEVSQLAPVTAP